MIEIVPSRKRRRSSKLQNVTFLKLFLSTPSLNRGADAIIINGGIPIDFVAVSIIINGGIPNLICKGIETVNG